jgi:ferredoxin-NADP reductase
MKLKLIEQKNEVMGVVSFVFTPTEPLTWQAGQFLHYVLHHEPTDNRGSDRWFTVASAPSEKKVLLTTRMADQEGSFFKQTLSALKQGETIEISDVEGDFVVDDLEREYVFIAGGIGITPFRAMLKEAEHLRSMLKVTLLYANRDNDILYRKELDAMALNNSNLTIRYFVTPEKINETSIHQSIPDLQKPIFYIAGPEAMVDDLGQILKSMGISPERIKQDWFPGYPNEV